MVRPGDGADRVINWLQIVGEGIGTNVEIHFVISMWRGEKEVIVPPTIALPMDNQLRVACVRCGVELGYPIAFFERTVDSMAVNNDCRLEI